MTVLVAAASKYGATQEIAEAIGRGLRERGLVTEVRSIADVGDLAPFAAVVLGSAVYAGHWLEEARRFGDEHAEELAARPTWLFSSGRIADPPRPSEEEAVQIEPDRRRDAATGAPCLRWQPRQEQAELPGAGGRRRVSGDRGRLP